MMTDKTVLRIAVVGSGPSGFYAVERLLKNDTSLEIDMFDRLPTPYGLVRGGVAPDHQKIKSVTKVYDKIAENPRFHFFGNVEIGRDITFEEMVTYYHGIIFAVGAQTDKRMDIPGEDLIGSYAATEFVAWYNGHPDYRHLEFDLSGESVAVVGLGNVAMDVARILARTPEELKETDIAEHALEALSKSKVKNIYLLGRRGPAQAAFTNPEIKELGKMQDADIVVDPSEVVIDPLSQGYLDSPDVDKKDVQNVKILQEYAQQGPKGLSRRIIARFLVSPTELLGTERVEAVKIVKNELQLSKDGSIRPKATDQSEIIPISLIFRSIGYQGVPIQGVPFYEKWGIVPNKEGRVVKEFGSDEVVQGVYVVGWIKRGPSGIIGTNKPDAYETADHLLEDAAANHILTPTNPTREAVESLLAERNIPYVTYEDWKILDQLEVERGAAIGRPRVKFTVVDEMLSALREYKEGQKVMP